MQIVEDMYKTFKNEEMLDLEPGDGLGIFSREGTAVYHFENLTMIFPSGDANEDDEDAAIEDDDDDDEEATVTDENDFYFNKSSIKFTKTIKYASTD